MAGCTAMDVISILRKKRQEVEVRGSRVEEPPKVYDSVEVLYKVRGKAARITSRYEIEGF